MIGTANNTNPYPGLRSFEFDESYLFFGREELSKELLQRLQRHRFLAVVGTSGSGKSSLVKAGLLPLLHGGFMAGSGSHWRVVLFRPGDQPIHNLAVALNSPDACESPVVPDNGGKPVAQDDASVRRANLKVAVVETVLRRSALGLVEHIKRSRKEGENFLIVVDQFEELFRFKERALTPNSEDEAAGFVKLLLEATQSEVPICVVITMRSDFFGDCAQFRDLPEAINDCQYLIPRLTRSQQRKAIMAPASVYRATLTPRLIHRLLNDVGDDPDQLPILQHALMRTWTSWSEENKTEQIDVPDYEKIGGMKEALSKHADEAFNALKDENSRAIAEKLFKALSESQENRVIRRPATVAEICEIAEANQEAVIEVINTFRGEHTSFLMPPAPAGLTAETFIDISHESLIRNWLKLKEWAEQEKTSAQAYRRLVEAAVAYQQERGNLLRDLDLSSALKWKEDNNPTAAWAKRYSPLFDLAMGFLARSEESFAAEKEKERREKQDRLDRQRDLLLSRQEKAEAERLRAEAEKRSAQEAQLRAEAEHRRAEAEKQQEHEARLRAEAEHERAKEKETAALELARAASERATEQELVAQRERRMVQRLRMLVAALVIMVLAAAFMTVYAFRQRAIAVANAGDAEQQRAIAVANARDAETQQQLAQASAHEAQIQRQTAEQLAESEGIAKDKALQAEQAAKDAAATASREAKRAEEQKERAEKQATELRQTNDKLTQSNQREKQQAFDLGRQELLSGSPLRALVYLNETNVDEEKQNNPALRFLLAQTTRSIDAQLRTLPLASNELVNQFSRLIFNLRPFATFSPNGSFVVTTREDNAAVLWDPEHGTIKYTLRHRGSVNSAAVSPDNKLVATVSDNLVKLWKADTGAWIPDDLKDHSGNINSVEFSSKDSERLLTASDDGTAIIWDLRNLMVPKLLFTLPHSKPEAQNRKVNYATFSPDGTLVVTVGEDHNAQLWDAKTGSLKFCFCEHTKGVLYAAFDPNAPRVTTASADGTAIIWDTVTGNRVATLNGHTNEAVFVAYGRKVIVTTGKDGMAILWDSDSGKLLSTLKGHSADVVYAQFSYAGELESAQTGRLVTASLDGSAKIWDVPSGKLVMTLDGHTGSLFSARFSNDGKRVVTASSDKSAILWNVEKLILLKHIPNVAALSFNPQLHFIRSEAPIFDKATNKYVVPAPFTVFNATGDRFVTASLDPVNTRQGIWIRSTSSEGPPPVYLDSPSTAQTAAFTHQGDFIVTGDADGSARIWDASSGEKIKELTGHIPKVNYVAFDKSGNRVVIAGNDGTADVYDVSILFAIDEKGKRIVNPGNKTSEALHPLFAITGHLSEVYSATFSSDGKYIVTASGDRTAQIWDAATGQPLRTLSGHHGRVLFAAFNPSNRLIVTASTDGTAKVWDWETGGLLATLEGHTHEVRSVTFNSDGTQMATIDVEGTAIIWDMKPEERTKDKITELLAKVPYEYRDGQVVLKPRQ